ncbi:hypothetical protein N7448_005354 [Penicillium atrosanguineum]|uniref:uncharacterized protein n=1 Tax=Penicillium atrosanguineum TaxID=1132637 RepID=UPI00238CE606|nr:uncharacterized protein N7443_009085 [Penicillium atrosanguineum]KAJ5126044.1 hypothetical protein N7526_008221 [Penicillium atrosanguineum]KAJ5136800.1 hypothetical protein N7448_005354 [Penicillium atrosanguineum]KAJ5293132.1 hypothetical protein N7443_009085 [Penicillium atrosanguineum]
MGSAHSGMSITLSSTTPIFMLSRYRKSGSQSYSPLEIAIDISMCLLLLGVYISGIFILASREIGEWADIYNYKLARGIPQVYSNLSCILLSLLYLRSFAQGFFHKCIKPMFEARRVNYTLCPACDRSVDAPMTQSQDVTVAGQERPSISTDNLQGLYTDDVESQPLLPQSSLGVEDKQTTGIVTNN